MQEATQNLITSGAGATVQGVMGIIQGYYGRQQMKKAAAMERDLHRPTYGIPTEETAYLNDAKMRALQGLPEQQRQNYINQNQRGAAYANAALVDRGAGLQGVSAMQQNLNQGNANLLGMDAMQNMQNRRMLDQARMRYAGYQDKEFQYNLDEPYRNKAAAIRALYGSGIQNAYGGLTTVANSGATFAGSSGGGQQNARSPYENPNDGYYKRLSDQRTPVEETDGMNNNNVG